MAYTDVNTPVIQQVQLPSGDKFYIADRQIRNRVDTLEGYTLGTTYTDYTTTPIQDQVKILEQAVAGGVSFIVAWDGQSTPVVANIPEGVVVDYQSSSYTGTKAASSAQAGAFYLVAVPNGDSNINIYQEYVAVDDSTGTTTVKKWQMIGTTKVTVSLTKVTDDVLGANTTFNVTQPTITIGTAQAGTTGYTNLINGLTTKKASASTSWNSKDSVTAVTGYPSPTTATVVTSSAGIDVTPTTTYVKATASGANTAWNSKDSVTAVTGVGLASNGSSATGRVQTATGSTTSSTTNTDVLKGISVSNGVLSIDACTLNTTYLGASTTTDTVIGTDSTFTITQPTVALATESSSATGRVQVMTGATAALNDVGATVLTGLGTADTDSVIGADSTLTTTLAVDTTTGDITVATGATSVGIRATASGAAVSANSDDTVTVLTSATDIATSAS